MQPEPSTTQSISLTYRQSTLHYHTWGEGANLLIAFHGFGDSSKMFFPLQSKNLPNTRVVSLDLPFHGETTWREESFDIRMVEEIVDILLERYEGSTLSLMGFSFGARIVQGLIHIYFNIIKKIYFIVPDGLVISRTYNQLLKAPDWSKRLIIKGLGNTNFINSITTSLHNSRRISRHSMLFVQTNLSSKYRLERLGFYWKISKEFSFEWKKIESILIEKHTPIVVMLATRDEVIPFAEGEHFFSSLLNLEFVKLEGNHRQARRLFYKKL